MLLSLACDESDNKSGSGDDPTNGTKTPTPATTTIDIPENLSSDETSSTDGAYELSWDEVTGATTYKLREGEDTELELSSDDIQNRTHSVTDKETGSYDYQVQACDASGACSEWSDAITVHVFRAMAPTLTLTLTSTETRATDGTYRSADGIYTLTWTNITDAASYELEEVIQRGNREIYSGDANTHDVSGEMAKMTGSYRYQIRACHTNGVCSEWSSAVTVHVFTASAPTLTLDLTSTETRATDGTYSSADGIYTLTWTNITDAASYELEEGQGGNAESYRRIYSGPGRTSEADPTRRTHSIDTQPGGSYSYRLRACHANTACTAWSDLSLSVSRNCADSQQASGFQDGDGSSDSPYLICDYPQLRKMGEDDDALEKHYKLGRDINAIDSRSDGTKRSDADDDDCTDYNPAVKDDDSDPAPTGHPGHGNTCTGWKPVGTSASNAFTGSLQGAGYTIRNLYINISTTIGTTRVGLFGQTGSASVIQNVGMTDAYIKVDTASSRVGSLVGSNTGSLSNSYATGLVTASGDSFSNIGGLVGRNDGSLSNTYATISVTVGGSSSYVGGLVGRNGGSLSNSYATGSITASDSSSNIGGLVGRNDGSLSNSYATGSITASGSSSRIGGLVGWNFSGSFSNSYASGSVPDDSSPTVGGLVGRDDSGTINNDKNYYVANDGTNGIGAGGACAVANCIRAGEEGQSDDDRRMWLQNTLDESEAPPDGMGWLPANWSNFTGPGYPKLLYAQVEGYCSVSPTTLTTPDLCLAAGSCSGGTGSNRDACVEDGGMWTPTNAWLAGDDECGGSTGVRCGDVIPGQ